MKILHVVQSCIAAMGIVKLKQHWYYRINLRCIVASTTFILTLLSSGTYLLSDAKTVRDYTQCFYILVTATNNIFMFVVLFLGAPRFYQFISDAENMIDNPTFTDAAAKERYKKANEIVNKCSVFIHTIMIKVSIPVGGFPIAIISFYTYFTTDAGADSFILPIVAKLPFDWKTPTGYFVSIIMLILVMTVICHNCACMVMILVGFFGAMVTMGLNLEKKLHKLCDDYKITANETQIKNDFRDFLHFHAKTRQLTGDFNDFFELLETGYHVWSTVTICDTLLMFQTSDTVFDAALAFALLFWSVIQILIFCESGERLTNQFMKINDGIFDSEWYTFSDDLQRKLPIIISGTRLPTYICGYGNILCTRDTCKSVFSGSFSYFNVLRQFY